MEEKKRNKEITDELRELTLREDLFSDEKTFSPPDGYFQNLSDNLLTGLKNTNGTPEAEDIPMSNEPLLFSRRMMRYGIAAITIGILALVAWWYFLFPHIEAKNGISAHEHDLIQDIQPVTGKDIEDYIESGAIPLSYGDGVAIAEINDESIRVMLADISVSELEDYLETEDSIN